LGDVNGDGKDDIVGFGATNVFVSLSNGNGTFGVPIASNPGFTKNVGGWSDNNNYPRLLADVNGDNRDDIVGFGATNVFVSLSNGNGTFGAPVAYSPGLTKNIGGWTDNNNYPRVVGDVNKDGKDDLIGFGASDVFVSLSGSNVTPPPPPPVWENPLGLGSYSVSQEFGLGHTGIDLAASTGTPIEAARSGKVVFVGTDQYGGKYIDIDHGSGLKTRYLHLSTFAVSVGTVVNDDTKIGAVGSTGLSTGPHLHFEVWQNGVRQNPRNYLSF
jgi:murein DD-endopeptidase MepM/ murein hydrolase activator NlpD